MRQPVYLNAPRVVRVTLEGPALRIHARDQADRFLPIARLARIVSRGKIQWSTPALLQCLRSGVPVTFLDSKGRAVGLCFSAWPHYSPLSELLDGFFANEAGPERLVNWFRSQSRRRLLRLLRRHRIEPPDLRTQTVRRHLRAIWQTSHENPEPVTPIKSLLSAHIVETLTHYRIEPALMEPAHDWAGLTTYLKGILEWDLWDLALSGKLQPGSTHKARVACYQRHAAQLETAIRNQIGRLWRWLEQGGSEL